MLNRYLYLIIQGINIMPAHSKSRTSKLQLIGISLNSEFNIKLSVYDLLEKISYYK